MDSDFPLRTFLSLATRGELDPLGPHTAKAFRETDAAYWEAYLGPSRDTGGRVDTGPLVFGITTSDGTMRFASLWHLLLELTSGTEAPPAVRQALATAISRRESAEDVEEAFLLELLAREGDSPPQERTAWTAMLEEGKATRLSLASGQPLLLLTERERRALSKHRYRDEKALDDDVDRLRNRSNARTSRQGRAPTQTKPTLKTVSGFPQGLLSDLLEVTGCKGSEMTSIWGAGDDARPDVYEGATMADVRFAMDGHRIGATFLVSPNAKPNPCTDAGRALILSSINVPDSRSKEGAWNRLVVLHSEEFFSCLKEPQSLVRRLSSRWTQRALRRPESLHVETLDLGELPARRRFSEIGKDIRPPKKVKDMQPRYPESARQDRVQGIVILEAIITHTGCVRSIGVLRSVDGRLDIAALLAVSQWRYEPTLLNGEPVPIVMTVTVNFTLS